MVASPVLSSGREAGTADSPAPSALMREHVMPHAAGAKLLHVNIGKRKEVRLATVTTVQPQRYAHARAAARFTEFHGALLALCSHATQMFA